MTAKQKQTFIDRIASLSEKDAWTELINVIKAAGLDTKRFLMFKSAVGMAYTIRDAASAIYLEKTSINPSARFKLQVFSVAEAVDLFNTNDRIAETVEWSYKRKGLEDARVIVLKDFHHQLKVYK